MDTHLNLQRKTAAGFGDLLRRWRIERHVSQLTLANQAEISGRHVSFLETGRAQPSRDMVQRLATALDIPLSRQNELLLAAGFAPVYGQRQLTAPELDHVRRAMEFILRQQDPYPAIVVDGGWNIVMQNTAAVRIFGLFLEPRASNETSRNALHALFRPDGMRRYIVNWEELVEPLLQYLHREVAVDPDSELAALRDALLTYPGVPSRWSSLDPNATLSPLQTLKLCKDELSLTFFSTLTTFATPRDITLQGLRIECFHPADVTTEKLAMELARDSNDASR